jgi:antitoxin component of RelBE/YafQ-DinJ toxin-antitoxin module
MLMQPTAAALCAVCLAAPLALPGGGALANVAGHDLTASAAAVNLAAAVSASPAALPAAPTLLEVLGLPIQTANNIFAEGTTGAQALPAGFPLTSAQYVSVFEALNAYIKVGSTVAAQLVNGQFESISPSFQTNLAAAMTALQGLPPSIAASLQYNLGVIQAFIATLGAATPTSTATVDAKTVAVSAATSAVLPTNPTLLEVLGLPIQTANNIFAEGTTGAQALPAGFPLTSQQYVSVFEALNAYIKVGSTIAAQLVNGQFESIPVSFQTNLAAADTALMSLAPSVAASLQYNLGVIQNFFAAPTATATADKTLAVSAATPTALPANPTLLDVLGLQIQTANNISAAGTTGASALPAGFPLTAAQYVSVFNVLNAYIKIGSTVATQLVNGQFEAIAPSFQTNLTAANTALQGFAPSVTASLQYDFGVIQNFFAAPNATATATAGAAADTKTLAVAAATPTALPANPTLLDVLGLQIQTANNIFAAGTTGAQALPPGFPLTAAQYVSVFTAANAYIKVGSTVATQLVNGQFEAIAPSFQTNLNAANTTLQGLAPSIGASLQYDAGVVGNFFAGGAATTTAARSAAVTADSTEKATDSADSVTELPKAELKAGPKSTAPTGGFLKQLQSAVDNEVGGGKVKVTPKPGKHSDETKASDSTKSDSNSTKSDKKTAAKADSSAK